MYTHACSCMHIAHKTLANAHAWCAACAFFSSLKARAATGPTFRQAHNCTQPCVDWANASFQHVLSRWAKNRQHFDWDDPVTFKRSQFMSLVH